MIGVYIALFSLVGWAWWLKLRLPVIGNQYVMVMICSIIFVLFTASGIGWLSQAALLIVISGLGLLVKIVLASPSRGGLKLPWFLGCFLVASLVLIYFARDAYLWNWDEFFWVLFPRSLKLENTWYTTDSPILQSKFAYPPGAPLWQYYFIILGSFHERSLFIAVGILMIGLILTISGHQPRYWPKILSFLLMLYVWWALVIDPSGLLTIYIDPTLGFMFGWGLHLVFEYAYRKDISRWLFVVPAVILPLIKQSGLVMSGTIIAFAFLKQRFEATQNSLSWKKQILTHAVVVVVTLIPIGLWQRHVSIVADPDIPGVSTIGLVNALTGRMSPRQTKIWKAQYRKLVGDEHVMRTFSFFSFIWFIFLFSWSKKKPIRTVLYGGFFLIGFYGWMILMLMIYARLASPGYEYKLPSFWRYTSSYYVGIFLVGLIFIRDKKVYIQIPILVGTIIYFYSLFSEYRPLHVNFFKPTESSVTDFVAKRRLYEPVVAAGQKLLDKSKIWIIAPYSDGFVPMYLRQALFPRRTNWWCWRLGKPIHSTEVWTCPLSPKQWSEILMNENFSHLLVLNSDDAFWKRYGDMFFEVYPEYSGYYEINFGKGIPIFEPIQETSSDYQYY